MSQRWFIGLPLSEEAERRVARVVKRLKRSQWKVRWEPREKWHQTLVFLGVTAEEQAKEIQRILTALGGGMQFEVRLKGVDTFPRQEMSPKYGERIHGLTMRRLRLRQKPTMVLPKLIYLRLGGNLRALNRLGDTVRRDLDTAKLAFDHKPLRPHVTIGRIEPDCGRAERIEIGKTIAKFYNLDIPQRWTVERVRWYESTLKPEGSVYQVIDEVKLRQ
ncbi:hypothetical protein A2W24_05475 [Microgenomates group bacterium RBG_16_45_19]|nr:MAG: hypothetical protein A2W24_05475 [Microgenomates group bacterium RBG_16_45_19]